MSSSARKVAVPHDVTGFLADVKHACVAICEDQLVSLRLFGSLVDCHYRPGISDVDFLVLVKDDCPVQLMNQLRAELLRLELIHNIADARKAGTLQRAIISRTLFFRSHFVFHESTLLKQDYARLIGEAEAFGLTGGKIMQNLLSVLVPWRLVLANVITQSQLFDGTDRLGEYKPLVQWRVEAARVFVMTEGISLLGLVYSLLSKDGTRISLEALKWYLIGKGSCLMRKRTGLGRSLSLLRSPRSNVFFERFEKLRGRYSLDRFFALFCPLFIAYLQIARNRKPLETLEN